MVVMLMAMLTKFIRITIQLHLQIMMTMMIMLIIMKKRQFTAVKIIQKLTKKQKKHITKSMKVQKIRKNCK